MIELTREELATVRAIAERVIPGLEIRVFGSRARRTAQRYSDLDLLVCGPRPLDLGVRAALREAFEESALPMSVDLVDWHDVAPERRASIERESVPL
jgi:predicted nucleotidyltransferase